MTGGESKAPQGEAPGRPGIEPRWTSSAKSGVGTAVNPASKVWFTLSHGILDEIYWPEVDTACTRDLGFIVTDGKEYFAEEKRHTRHRVEYLAEGVPAYRLTNECEGGRFRIEKEIVTDPRLDVLLVHTRFVPLDGSELFLYLILAPHLENAGANNRAWIETRWGQQFLHAQRAGSSLALACSAPFLNCSAGYVGISDGWQDLQKHKKMEWTYASASEGNVALTAQIDLDHNGGEFTLALGFDEYATGAAHHARASLLDGFASSRDHYVAGWRDWQKSLPTHCPPRHNGLDYHRLSASVLRVHQAKRFPGGSVASLSIPWGFSKGDDDRGGYHLAWVRDLAQVAGGLIAAGGARASKQVLRYLAITQKAEGNWPQNMWLAGGAYWSGQQMDECAFPILLVASALREKLIDQEELQRLWPMVRRALAYIVQNGPATEQDRWEEVSGYSPFTIAVQIAALLEAAEFTPEPELSDYLRATADCWNDSIERWTYVRGTDLAARTGVDGYYVRIAPAGPTGAQPNEGLVSLKNLPGNQSIPAPEIVSTGFLAFVRYGLRAADDRRILNTVRVTDELLKVDTPNGPSWHRYNRDGYGEHEDGAPFDGTGVGRAWPLLTGERGHYELAAERTENARAMLRAMEAFSSDGGMIPEQIWDAADIPERALFCGQPSGSGMPLCWAHAEYIKLSRSLHDGRVFDQPQVTTQRYLVEKRSAQFGCWRFSDQIQSLGKDKALRFEVLAPATVHWSIDGWATARDSDTIDSKLGTHYVHLRREELPAGGEILFTFQWRDSEKWEGRDFRITL